MSITRLTHRDYDIRCSNRMKMFFPYHTYNNDCYTKIYLERGVTHFFNLFPFIPLNTWEYIYLFHLLPKWAAPLSGYMFFIKQFREHTQRYSNRVQSNKLHKLFDSVLHCNFVSDWSFIISLMLCNGRLSFNNSVDRLCI